MYSWESDAFCVDACIGQGDLPPKVLGLSCCKDLVLDCTSRQYPAYCLYWLQMGSRGGGRRPDRIVWARPQNGLKNRLIPGPLIAVPWQRYHMTTLSWGQNESIFRFPWQQLAMYRGNDTADMNVLSATPWQSVITRCRGCRVRGCHERMPCTGDGSPCIEVAANGSRRERCGNAAPAHFPSLPRFI